MRPNTFNGQFKIKYKIISIILILIFLFIILFLAKIMFLDKKYYDSKLLSKTEKIYYGETPPRGNIYDRNGKMLVGNVLIKSIVFQNDELNELEKIKLIKKIKDKIKVDYIDITNEDIKNYYLFINKEKL